MRVQMGRNKLFQQRVQKRVLKDTTKAKRQMLELEGTQTVKYLPLCAPI